jgi:hypothetical protein
MQLTWKDAKEKQLYFFLFTDLLVCCDKKKGNKKGPGEEFSLLFSLPLATVLRLGTLPAFLWLACVLLTQLRHTRTHTRTHARTHTHATMRQHAQMTPSWRRRAS